MDTSSAILGNYNVIYTVVDDKARAPCGSTLTNKQSAVLSGIECVRLSDHDFPYGKSHCYNVSVYSVYHISSDGHINDDKRVSWSRITQIFVRSSYHESQRVIITPWI